MKRKSMILTVIFGLLLGGIALYFLFSEAVAIDRFARVRNGMTEAQLRELLGAPDRIRRGAPFETAFCYGGFQRCKWCSVEIYFGADRRVSGKFHDH